MGPANSGDAAWRVGQPGPGAASPLHADWLEVLQLLIADSSAMDYMSAGAHMPYDAVWDKELRRTVD
eukprot:12704545-Heterocapsa_arctica.AAC.1